MIGFINFGSYTLGYREITCYFYQDIAPELQRNQRCYLSGAFIRNDRFWYGSFNSLLSSFISFYIYHIHIGPPYTHFNIFIHYAEKRKTEWKCSFNIDTSTFMCYTESVFTNTPLLLKYPKYYNWYRIPQVLTPRFTIWSYYDLDLTSIDVFIKYTKSNKTILKILNSAVNKDKVIIKRRQENAQIYEIEAYFDDIIPENTEVEIGITCQDIKGNWLKDGLW